MSKKKPVKKFIHKKSVATVLPASRLPSIKFPSISRIIPELSRLTKAISIDAWVIGGFVTGILIMGIAVSVYQLYQVTKTFEAVRIKESQTKSQLVYWEKVVKKYAGYRDGYIQLAALSYQLKDELKAKENIEKALRIDPLSKTAQVLKDKIGE